VPVLAVHGLSTSFTSGGRTAYAVREVSFDVSAGRTVGIVGESGSGKTITALSVMGLLPPGASVTSGRIELDGVGDLTRVSQNTLRSVRGTRIAMIFQDSMTSLNPLLTIETQIVESLRVHLGLRGGRARARALELLEEMGVPEPERRLSQFPHQLSGGLRQRVAAAVALAPDPDVLIADEPTTALDVTIQAQLLELLRREQQTRGMALILITHDLGVVAGMADEVCVMYAGRVVEYGEVDAIFKRPRHPYTKALLDSVPRLSGALDLRLRSIPGNPPSIWDIETGCSFSRRCPIAFDRCSAETPPLTGVPGRLSACFAVEEEE